MRRLQRANLPGVGRKYWLEADDGGRISIIAYHGGGYEVYLIPPGEEFPTSAVRLSGEEAAALGTAFPRAGEAREQDASLPSAGCVVAPASSSVVGQDAASLGAGDAFVAAVLPAGGAHVVSPRGHTVRAADVLWLMGPDEDREALAQRIRGS